MKVIWHEPAKRGRRQISAYIRHEFGTKRDRLFRQQVADTVDMLKRNPGIGQIDPLFANQTTTYRSIIINGLNKMVYCVDGSTIHIVGFWDTRMEPTTQAGSVL